MYLDKNKYTMITGKIENTIKPLALPVCNKNLYGSEINPICINRELIGPPSANNVKNNIENADAMINIPVNFYLSFPQGLLHY